MTTSDSKPTADEERPLGILAGGGALPVAIAEHLGRSGRDVHIVGLVGEADAAIERFPHTWVRWGQIGAIGRALRHAGCRELVIVGAVKRPDLGAIRPDVGFFTSFPVLLRLLRGGDDSVLSRVVRFFEHQGFKVRGAHEVVPRLVARPGTLSEREPSSSEAADAEKGLEVITALAPFDIGQAVVVVNGDVKAIEAVEGTDRMLQRIAGGVAAGGVLIKTPKAGQELRIDMPAIGPRTVRHATEARLAGIAVSAGNVLLAERSELLAEADRTNLFVCALPNDQDPAASNRWSATRAAAGELANSSLYSARPLQEGARNDIAKSVAVMRALSQRVRRSAFVLARQHVLALGVGEALEQLLERAGKSRQWGKAISRQRAGMLAIDIADLPDASLSSLLGNVERVLDLAQQSHLAGLVLFGGQTEPDGLRQLVAAAAMRGLVVAYAPLPGDAGEGENSRRACIAVVAGEHSGDVLGGKLMAALKQHLTQQIDFVGLGAEHMIDEGLEPIFDMAEVAVMGPAAILRNLPHIVRRVHQTVDAVVAANPDIVVIIDSPEFTHPIARRIRKRMPDVPIIDYVSPSVWAWRPGRARRMRAYVDHVLALLPFEPEAHRRLGGPACTYVGHPIVQRIDWIDSLGDIASDTPVSNQRNVPVLLVLPGSRRSEVARLLEPFGETIAQLVARSQKFEVVIPVVRSVRPMVEAAVTSWAVKTTLVEGEEAKFRAFKTARAALAASGTVTLELAVAGTPMVVAYKVDTMTAKALRPFIKSPSAVLANLVLGRNAFPEFIQETCTPDNLASALVPLLTESEERTAQLAALREIRTIMGRREPSPSDTAARIVIDHMKKGRVDRPLS